MRNLSMMGAAALLVALLPHAAMAQTGPGAAETVSWTAMVRTGKPATPASTQTILLQARVSKGWHVYALKQLAAGPTPLRITVDSNTVASAIGAAIGSPATKVHDPSFNLDTPLYSHDFSAAIPVRLGAQLAAGRHLIPVSVRFQTCNGSICQPPKTVHLAAPVDVPAPN